MHICYRLKVPQVRQSDAPIEHYCIRTFFWFLVPIPGRTDNCKTFFILFMVDYDNLKFTLLISAGSRIDANHASGLDEALPGLWTTEDRRVPVPFPERKLLWK